MKPHRLPNVNTGSDQIVNTSIFPAHATLNGTVQNATSQAWMQVDGPSAVISNPISLTPTVTLPVAGDYTFRLSASNKWGTNSDDVMVTAILQPGPSPSPIVHAGPDQTIQTGTFPATVSLSGSVQNALSFSWSQVSGPSAAISNLTILTPTVTMPVPGDYGFRLTATNTAGSASSDVLIHVSPPVNVVYVDINKGSDSNSGSQTAPWRTIQHAADMVMVAGTTVMVQPGIYNERVTVSHSGVFGNPIFFHAAGTVVVRGFALTGNFITVQGFTITGATANGPDFSGAASIYISGSNCIVDICSISHCALTGVTLAASSRNAIVRNCIIQYVGLAGIWSEGNGHQFLSNDISHILTNPPEWSNVPSWTDADGIVFGGSGGTSDNILVRANDIHHILLSDQIPGADPHIDGFDNDAGLGNASNVIIEKNKIHDLVDSNRTTQAGMIQMQNQGWIIRNNLCYNLGRGWNFEGGNPQGVKVHNNTFFNIADYYVDVSSGSVDIRNNIAFQTRGLSTSGSSSTESNNLTADPRFVNPGTDFHLQPGSPAIDAGITLSDVKDDFDGLSRPQGTAYCIGAYEFH